MFGTENAPLGNHKSNQALSSSFDLVKNNNPTTLKHHATSQDFQPLNQALSNLQKDPPSNETKFAEQLCKIIKILDILNNSDSIRPDYSQKSYITAQQRLDNANPTTSRNKKRIL